MTPPPGTYNVQVWNQNPPEPNSGKAGWQESTISSGHVVAQAIWINTQTTDPCAVGQTTAHETGHGFGLGHAENCDNNSSVMKEATGGYNALTGTYGPTPCDNSKVNQIAHYPTPNPSPPPPPPPDPSECPTGYDFEHHQCCPDPPLTVDHSGDKIPRSHWDMLLERRTLPELEELLEERLAYVRARRGAGEDVTLDKISA